MKKFLSILCLALVLCCALTLVACKDAKIEDIKNFKLSFVVDGQVISTMSTDGESIKGAIPSDPTKDGYTFDGWYLDENVWTDLITAESLSDIEISSDISLYAKFSVIEYSITYDANGGKHSNASKYTVEDSVSLDPAEKAGYAFEGWYSSAEYTEKVTSIAKGTTGNVSLYAKYTPVNYTITYQNTKEVANGNPTTYHIETPTFTLADLQLDGYTFQGWYNGDKKVTSIAKGTTGNIELSAAWELNEYTITYQDTKDAENPNPTTYTAESENITLLPLSKEGFIFVNWTDEQGAVITILPAAELKNRTITATWTPCVNHVPDEHCKCVSCGKTVHTPGANCACTVCGATVHTLNDDCVCANCGKTVHGVKEGAYCKHGDYVYFGTYPQTQVTDSAITSALTAMAGTLPTPENAQKWTDYGYYQGDKDNHPVQESYMWYIDLEKDGVKYRGVYFTKYRPNGTRARYLGIYDTYQDDHGYETGNVYWFTFEPIKWRILTTEDGIATLLCEMAIDTQNVYFEGENLGYITTLPNGQKIYQNNYEYSTIRTWLNENFYNAAFNDLEKSVIQLTTVDNSARSGNPNNNETLWDTGRRPCSDTQDYVYLPSEQEVTNSDYGFNSSYSSTDVARQKQSTDYAKSQGCYTECSWWLRSPQWSTTYTMKVVSVDGMTYRDRSVTNTTTGVAPALRIQL